MSSGEIRVGVRFECDGNIGTVRYVGDVPPTEGLWLGVEWDDESRGKHDGCYEGIRYFKTSYPKSGSFIRPVKVDFGITCLDAISEKYGKVKTKTEVDNKMEEKLFILQKNNSILPIEAVGIDKIGAKQNKLCSLQDVSISSMKVNGAGSENELASAVPNIVNLDLSQSLINSWEEVARIAGQLHHLRSLNLSINRLTIPSDPETLQENFTSLRMLILSKMNLTWQQVLWCSNMWTNVVQLQVPFNKISSLETPTNALRSVEHLDLDGNLITNWSEVLTLGHLPKLRFLNLNGNGIQDIYFDDVPPDGKTSLFPVLEVLYLRDNKINKLQSLNELNKLVCLNEIMIKKNPFWNLEKSTTIWQIIVAKLSGLKLLNRSSISPGERRGAELDYLLKYGKEWLAVENGPDSSAKAEFLKHHPRYLQLVKVHGAFEESELNVQSPSLKTSLISISIHCPQIAENKPLVKKLPGSMTVQKLRSLVHRLLKLEMENVVLSCSSTKSPKHEVEMNNDLRQLSFYVESGDQVFVRWR